MAESPDNDTSEVIADVMSDLISTSKTGWNPAQQLAFVNLTPDQRMYVLQSINHGAKYSQAVTEYYESTELVIDRKGTKERYKKGERKKTHSGHLIQSLASQKKVREKRAVLNRLMSTGSFRGSKLDVKEINASERKRVKANLKQGMWHDEM